MGELKRVSADYEQEQTKKFLEARKNAASAPEQEAEDAGFMREHSLEVANRLKDVPIDEIHFLNKWIGPLGQQELGITVAMARDDEKKKLTTAAEWLLANPGREDLEIRQSSDYQKQLAFAREVLGLPSEVAPEAPKATTEDIRYKRMVGRRSASVDEVTDLEAPEPEEIEDTDVSQPQPVSRPAALRIRPNIGPKRQNPAA